MDERKAEVETNGADKRGTSSFVIHGCGNSTGVPWLYCVIDPTKRCRICQSCIDDPASKNRRNNPCAMIRVAQSDGRTRNILIDCGKTFRDCVLKGFLSQEIHSIDAILITHAHADAYLGLDDIRDVSPNAPVPIYVTKETYAAAARVFPYLVTPPSDPSLFVARLEWHIIKEWEPFNVLGVEILPLPVEHGKDYTCIGYEFGVEDSRVVYLSDVSVIPDRTMEYILSKPTHLLVLDALSYRSYPTHLSFPESVSYAKRISAERTMFVGMNHSVDYHEENAKLAALTEKEGLNPIALAYDGWSTELRL